MDCVMIARYPAEEYFHIIYVRNKHSGQAVHVVIDSDIWALAGTQIEQVTKSEHTDDH